MSTWIKIIKNLERNKLRTILYGLTFFLIGNLLLTGVTVYRAADQAVILTRQKLKPLVSYEINYDTIRNNSTVGTIDYYDGKDFTIHEAIAAMAADDRVVAINNLVENQSYPQDFSAFSLDDTENPYEGATINLIGNLTANMVEFYDGTNTIVEGRFYTDEEVADQAAVVVINDKLASLNNLKINDYITVDLMSESNSRYNAIPEEYRTLELKVIGIYEASDQTFSQSDYYGSKINLYPNQLYLPGSILAEAKAYIGSDSLKVYAQNHPEDDIDNTEVTPEQEYNQSSIIMLDDPENMDAFCQDYAEYTTSYLTLNKNNTAYETMAKPLKTMTYFAKLLMEAVAIASVIIIGIITAMSLKMRQFELAMLLAGGISKAKIVLQLLAELLIIAVVALGLSSITGSFIAKDIGNKVLEYQQVTDVDDDDSYQLVDEYFDHITSDELLDNYQVTINAETYLEMYGASLIIVTLATVIPTLVIMSIDPKKIMSRI